MHQVGSNHTEENFHYSKEHLKKDASPSLMQQFKATMFTQSKNKGTLKFQVNYADAFEGPGLPGRLIISWLMCQS